MGLSNSSKMNTYKGRDQGHESRRDPRPHHQAIGQFLAGPNSNSTHCLVLEELGKLVPGLRAVGITLPVVRHVVDVSEDHAEQLLRAEHQVLVWDKGPAGPGSQ